MNLCVAMCTYNGGDYLSAQLQSIAEQTRQPHELVICDDGSTDATVDIVEAFAAAASFPVRLYRNADKLGSTKNFEKAIGLCTGDVIALADQDDIWRSEKLARVESIFAAAPEVGLVFSDAELADAMLRPMDLWLWDVVGGKAARRQLRRPERAFSLLLPGWTVTGATMAFRSEFRRLVLPIPTDIGMIHDGWIALLVSAVARVHFIDEPLIVYRQHLAQQVGARSKRRETASLRTAMCRVTSYTDLLTIIAATRLRLRSSELTINGSIQRELEALARHYEARNRLPASWHRRLPVVLREFLTRRYHRYGRGLKSAAKDLVIGTRRMTVA